MFKIFLWGIFLEIFVGYEFFGRSGFLIELIDLILYGIFIVLLDFCL